MAERKKLRVLIVGGDDRNITDDILKNIDLTHVEQTKKKIEAGVCPDAQVVVVITKFVSRAMWDMAKKFAKQRKIPLIQALTGNYVLHELKEKGILKEIIHSEPVAAKEEVPTPKKEEHVGISPDEVWNLYGQKAIDTVKAVLKPGEKIAEDDLLTLLSDSSSVGLPKEDVIHVLPELAVRGVVTNIRGKTWKVPKITDFGTQEEEEAESEEEVKAVLVEEKKGPEPDTEQKDKSTIPQHRRTILAMVEKMSGLPAGPYRNYGDLWREVIKYEEFKKPDGTYGTDAQLWHWLPKAIEFGLAKKEEDGQISIIHDDKVTLTQIALPDYVDKHEKGTLLFRGCPRHGRHYLDDRRNPTKCENCDSALTLLCDDEGCKLCPECEVCKEERKKKGEADRKIEKEKQAKKAKTDEEVVRAIEANYDGHIPVLDKYAIPIRALKKMIPSLYWDSMACQTVAKIVNIGHHDNAQKFKDKLGKLEWDRLAYETIRNLPIETIAPFLKDEQKDIELKCVECLGKFTFTVGEQKFFEGKFDEVNVPKRCPDCRKKLRTNRL